MTADQKRAIAYVLTGIFLVGTIVGWAWSYRANLWSREEQ